MRIRGSMSSSAPYSISSSRSPSTYFPSGGSAMTSPNPFMMHTSSPSLRMTISSPFTDEHIHSMSAALSDWLSGFRHLLHPAMRSSSNTCSMRQLNMDSMSIVTDSRSFGSASEASILSRSLSRDLFVSSRAF